MQNFHPKVFYHCDNLRICRLVCKSWKTFIDSVLDFVVIPKGIIVDHENSRLCIRRQLCPNCNRIKNYISESSQCMSDERGTFYDCSFCICCFDRGFWKTMNYYERITEKCETERGKKAMQKYSEHFYDVIMEFRTSYSKFWIDFHEQKKRMMGTLAEIEEGDVNYETHMIYTFWSKTKSISSVMRFIGNENPWKYIYKQIYKTEFQ